MCPSSCFILQKQNAEQRYQQHKLSNGTGHQGNRFGSGTGWRLDTGACLQCLQIFDVIIPKKVLVGLFVIRDVHFSSMVEPLKIKLEPPL